MVDQCGTEEDVNVCAPRVPARAGDSRAMRNRRAVVGLSLVGIASMAITGQTETYGSPARLP